MKKILSLIVITSLVSSIGAYHFASEQGRFAIAKASELESVVTTKENELLGFTAYTNYLSVSKQTLSGQTKLLAASVKREEGVTQVVEKNVFGLSSDATIAIWYSAEYSFGYDLQPGSYDVKSTNDGIEVMVNKPTMVAPVGVTNLRHQILSKGVLVDAKGAVIKLQQVALENAQKQGLAMASEPAIQALCEKKLAEFLHDFLKKQAGVKAVPAIKVVYR